MTCVRVGDPLTKCIIYIIYAELQTMKGLRISGIQIMKDIEGRGLCSQHHHSQIEIVDLFFFFK